MLGRTGVMTVAALCAAAGFATTADAQAVPEGKSVTVKGCVFLQPPGCKRLGGYIVNAGMPAIPADAYVVATGKVSEYSGACFGPRLIDIKWKPSQGVCVPPPPAPPLD